MHWICSDSLPEIRGRVERVRVNLHGEPEGLILADAARGERLHTPRGAAMEAASSGEREDRLRPIEKPNSH